MGDIRVGPPHCVTAKDSCKPLGRPRNGSQLTIKASPTRVITANRMHFLYEVSNKGRQLGSRQMSKSQMPTALQLAVSSCALSILTHVKGDLPRLVRLSKRGCVAA